MRIFSFINYIFKLFPFMLLANVILLFLFNLVDAASIFSLVVVVDLFLNPGMNGSSPITQRVLEALSSMGLPVTIWLALIILILIIALKTAIQIFSQYLALKMKYAVCRNIIMGTFEDFFNARWYFFSSSKQGVLLNTFLREVNVIGDAFGVMTNYLSIVLQILLYLVLPFYLSWIVTSSILLSAIIASVPFLLLGKSNYRLGRQSTSTANEVTKIIQESFTLGKIILGFNKQYKSTAALKDAYDAHLQVAIKSQLFRRAASLAYYPLGLSILLIGLFISRKIALPVSETIALFYSLSRVMPLIGTLTEQKAQLDNFYPSYEQIINLRQHAKELKQLSGEKIFSGFDKEIKVDNLTFAYPNNPPVLKNINIVIPRGAMIGVVGDSGSGKSTFIDMLMHFNNPNAGSITFDGINLVDFDVASYRKSIGYVPQDSVLFNMSIRDNLLWANDIATEEDIKNACKQAHAEEFINKLPQGYNTLVGDRGVRLSGGQIQRIALARAILRKPKLLILDEATSALDTYSERLIQQAIEAVAKETTVVVVAHRLSTIKNADYIYVLKDGCIIEHGTCQELMQKNGNFKKMVELQALDLGQE